MDLQRQAGSVSGEVKDAIAASYVLALHLRRLAPARQLLDRVEPLREAFPEAMAALPYQRGLIEREAGNWREALRLFETARSEALRLGDTSFIMSSEMELAVLEHWLGRSNEAIATLELLLARDIDACDRARVLNSLGWFTLGSSSPWLRHDDDRVARARSSFDRAAKLYETSCKDSAELQNVLINLALCEHHAGDASKVEAHLASARRMGDAPPVLAAWIDLLEGYLAFGRGRHADALTRFERVRSLPIQSREVVWHAIIGMAEVQEARGHDKDALSAYVEAEALLDDRLRAIPMTSGPTTFLTGRESGTTKHVDLLVRMGRHEEAMIVARRARVRALDHARVLSRLTVLSAAQRERWEREIAEYRRIRDALLVEAEGDWKLSKSALDAAMSDREHREAQAKHALEEAFSVLEARAPVPPRFDSPPDEGELVLTLHPAGADYVLFAQTRSGVKVRRSAPREKASEEQLAKALLEPFDDLIESARRLRVLPYGPLKRVALHALPWRDAPLIAHKTVVYGLDVQRTPNDSKSDDRDALVVVDPRLDLPSARTEGDEIREALRRKGWNTQVLQGAEATRQVVTARLSRVGWMHHAGHAEFAGAEGWESSLQLAGLGELNVGDILALPRVPRYVVLSGCETGRSNDSVSVESLGLAPAFVLAGAGVVVAATESIDDKVARRLMKRVYERWESAGNLADAVAAAQAQAWRDGDRGWAAFRVWGP